MKKFLVPLLATVFLTGCLGTLVPKKVELFQDKVKAFPEQSPALVELERQAIYAAHEKATETVVAAIKEKATTNVVAPARDTMKLTEAAVVAAGPPKTVPSLVTPESPEKLAVKLEQAVGKYDVKVEEFAKKSDENVGKKIEGTGLIQVPYVLWTGGILLVIVVLFFAVKTALSIYSTMNPAAAIGVGGMNIAQSVVTKGFTQLVKGGEKFKDWVQKEFSGDQGVQSKILEAFKSAHMHEQDQDVQKTVQVITS